jgi:hypothetical protein
MRAHLPSRRWAPAPDEHGDEADGASGGDQTRDSPDFLETHPVGRRRKGIPAWDVPQ